PVVEDLPAEERFSAPVLLEVRDAVEVERFVRRAEERLEDLSALARLPHSPDRAVEEADVGRRTRPPAPRRRIGVEREGRRPGRGLRGRAPDRRGGLVDRGPGADLETEPARRLREMRGRLEQRFLDRALRERERRGA